MVPEVCSAAIDGLVVPRSGEHEASMRAAVRIGSKGPFEGDYGSVRETALSAMMRSRPKGARCWSTS